MVNPILEKPTQAHDSNIDLIRGFLIGKFRIWNPKDILSITRDIALKSVANAYDVVLANDAHAFFDNWESMENVFICNRYISISVSLNDKEFDLHLSFEVSA